MHRRANLICLLDADGAKVLLCRRMKPPYQGRLNLVGGKAEAGEAPLAAAQRELWEETGYTPAQAPLFPLDEREDDVKGFHLECWGGRLRTDAPPTPELNPLCWLPVTEDFADEARFAGEGLIQRLVALCLARCAPETLSEGGGL